MSGVVHQRDCLNCGAPLGEKFCGRCGQRNIAAHPSAWELLGDAWQELGGYDGKFLHTLRALLRRPGALTQDVVEGRRAQYISPVRLYLLASVAYFLVAAFVPDVRIESQTVWQSDDFDIGIGVWTPPSGAEALTPEQRVQLDRQIDEAPVPFRPVLRSMADDPEGFEGRLLSAIPKVFFALVPGFAAVLALFFWRRRFPQHLIFALHLHTVMFIALGLAKLPNITGSPPIVIAAGIAALLFIAQYALRAFHRVYGNSWLLTAVKMVGVAAIYGALFVPAMMAAMIWAARSR